MNVIKQNIRTLLITIFVITITWCTTISAQGQSITPSGIYPNEYAALTSLLPANMWDVIYDNSGKATFDKLLISIQLPEAYASALGLTANTPYIIVFNHNRNLKHDNTIGREEWYIANQTIDLIQQTIISSGALNYAAGQTIYYASNNYAGGMAAFGFPYITPYGIHPIEGDELISSHLPDDILTTLFNSSKRATMDNVFVATKFNKTETTQIQSEYGISTTENQSYMLPFCRVICSDGNDYYALTNITPTASTNFILDNINNKKFYFTGTVEEAYAGAGKETEGFFFIKGTDAEQVDIYLQDYKVNKVKSKSLGTMDLDEFIQGHSKGMASPFAIGSTGENAGENIFRVRFHTKGHNTLTGGATSAYEGSGIAQVLSDIAAINAAPISLRPIPRKIIIEGIETDETDLEYKACELSFDDEWIQSGAKVRTNGLLELPVSGDRSAPSIDLGTRYGRCVFDGGQYKLTTAGSNSMFYVSSMAICYRIFEMMGMTKYGVGSSVGSPVTDPEDDAIGYPTVCIKNGTFSTYSAEEIKSTIDVVAHGWYKDYTDLRLPFKTRIDGGTFNNCHVYRCNASAEQGVAPINTALEALCRNQIPVDAPNPTTGLTTLDLSVSHPTYGTASITPISEEGVYYAYPYLPGNCEASTSYMHNWVTVIPQMGAEGLLTMGGDIEVKDKIDGLTPQKNAFLFYTRLNEYTKKNASVDFGFASATIDLAISLGGDKEFSSITNTSDYTIEHGLYTMLSFNSNQWHTICPPYDVHNIYVIETLPDEKLSEHGLTAADKGTEKYLKAQGKCDGILAQGIVTSLCPDILSGKGSGVRMHLIDICRQTLGIEPYKLTHYNPAIQGHSAKEANYYLYEQVEDPDKLGMFTNIWNKANYLEDYANKWEYATPVEGTTYAALEGNTFTAPILMKKGTVYSILLPAGDDKYWDGKYLIFEGYGPQTLEIYNFLGTQILDPTYMDILAYDNNEFFLGGNHYFNNIEITAESERVYKSVNTDLKYDFERTEIGDVVLPWESYLAMNSYNTENYATLSALSPSKHAVQGAPQSDELTNIPLVKDRSLIAYEQEGMMLCAYTKQQIAVYGVDGILVWKGEMKEGEQQHLSIPAGVYIIQGEQEAVKIVIRK